LENKERLIRILNPVLVEAPEQKIRQSKEEMADDEAIPQLTVNYRIARQWRIFNFARLMADSQ